MMRNLNELLERRRALRSLKPVKISKSQIEQLARSASLAPSCFNNQPWRFVFVMNEPALSELKATLSKGNEWARRASMIIAVYSRPDYDCLLKDRRYYQLDCGMALGNLLLQATELGLIAHPIAGFDLKNASSVIGLQPEDELITLIIIGAHLFPFVDDLKDHQLEAEQNRPPRKSFEEFARII